MLPRTGRRRSPTAASICSSSRRSATSTRSAPRSRRSAACRDLPIVAQMTTEEDGNSLDGTPPEQFAPELDRARRRCRRRELQRRPGADARNHRAYGARHHRARCRRSPTPASRATSRAATSICRRPNTWRRTRGASPRGVRLVGGCCGTTPEHIRQIQRAVRDARAGGGARGGRAPRAGDAPTPSLAAANRSRERESRWRRSSRDGRFVVGVELLPPRGTTPARSARRCAQLGGTASTSSRFPMVRGAARG